MRINEYDIGDEVRISALFTSLGNVATDPTVITARVKAPGGTVTTYVYETDDELERDGAGQYHLDVLLTVAGTYYFRWEGTGAVTSAEERSFSVRTSQFS